MTSPDDMTPRRRELYLKILDNWPEVHEITVRLYFLDDHFPPDKLEKALKWLISNNLTGRRFVSWFNHVCSKSDLELHRNLLAVVDNSDQTPLIAGRNFKL